MHTSLRFTAIMTLTALILLIAGQTPGHTTETVLHSCTQSYSLSGENPVGQLVLAGGKFYGVTAYGLNGAGNVFSMTTTGAIHVVHEFAGGGGDGALPNSGLVVIGNTFYGVTINGGSGYGVLFSMSMSASGTVNILHTFAAGNDGDHPFGALLLSSDGNLYGTTEFGGANNQGIVFSYNPNSTAYAVLHSFNNSTDTAYNPATGLAEAGNMLYGVALNATGYYGGIYKLNKDGSGFAFVHGFASTDSAGYNPQSDLITADDGYLYGTCDNGGTDNFGTVYKIVPGPGSTDKLSVLWAFDGFTGGYPAPSNNSSQNRLIQGADHYLYGVTQEGGAYGCGTMFQLTLTGTCVPLSNFNTGDANGAANPLLRDPLNGNFYLTSYNGGSTAATGNSYPGYGAGISLSASGVITVIQSFYLHEAYSPYCDLVQVGTGKAAEYYGTLYSGGYFSSDGAIFKISATGAFSIVHQFDDSLQEGYQPMAGLTLYSDHNTLFGSTTQGGKYGHGTLFSVTTAGKFTVIHHFQPKEGFAPTGKLVLGAGLDKNLYGTCSSGGSSQQNPAGTIFTVSPTGSIFQVIHNFNKMGINGGQPNGALMPDGLGNLYGTTYYGGTNGYGTIFKVSTSGATFTKLFDFYYDSTHSVYPDGEYPSNGSLALTGSVLYGTTVTGGAHDNGAIWAYDTSNGAMSVLHSFDNSIREGDSPNGGVIYDSTTGNLYGTCYDGGTNGVGTIWKASISSPNTLTLRCTFSGSNGAYPDGGVLVGADGYLYLTTLKGGTAGYGTIVQQTP